MFKSKDEVICILGQIAKNIVPIIPFPIRLQNYPNSVYLEVITGEEYEDNTEKNDSICFGFVHNDGRYGYNISPEAVEHGEYKGNDYSVEALTEYTIDMINSCTLKVV